MTILHAMPRGVTHAGRARRVRCRARALLRRGQQLAMNSHSLARRLQPGCCCRSTAVIAATRSVPFQNGPPLQPPGGIFRVPVVASIPDGTVLAFAEDRYSHGDGNALQIVMRRSVTKGETWEGIQVVVNDTNARDAAMGDGVTNGMVVTDARTNRTLFFYNQCSHLCQYTKAFFISSKDSGRSWTPPVNITDVLLPSKAHPAGVDVVQWGEGKVSNSTTVG